MSQSLPNGTLIQQRYEVRSLLGQGAFASTYLALDLQNKRDVAVKAVSMMQLKDWKAFELFEREVAVLQSLSHPRIPSFLDYLKDDSGETYYLVQEYAEGRSLKDKLDEGWTPSSEVIQKIGRQLLEVLTYLGQRNPPVVHRDIKPANIMIDDALTVKLVDFGAAKDKMSSHTALGSTIVGTYGYMAPEQFQGQACPQSDIYAVGATLIHCLTGTSPSDLPHTRMKLDFSSYVSGENPLAALLDKMVEPAIEDRFDSPALLLEYLKNPQAWADAQKPRFPVKHGVTAGALVKPAGARLRIETEADGTLVLADERALTFNDFRRVLIGVMGLGVAGVWSFFALRAPSLIAGIPIAALVMGTASWGFWSAIKRTMVRRKLRIGPEKFVLITTLGQKETIIHSGETAQLNGIDYYLHEPGFFEDRRHRTFDLGIKEGLNRHMLLKDADVLEAQWAAQELEAATGIKSQTDSFMQPSFGTQLSRMANAVMSNLVNKVNDKWFK